MIGERAAIVNYCCPFANAMRPFLESQLSRNLCTMLFINSDCSDSS